MLVLAIISMHKIQPTLKKPGIKAVSISPIRDDLITDLNAQLLTYNPSTNIGLILASLPLQLLNI